MLKWGIFNASVLVNEHEHETQDCDWLSFVA